MIALVKRFRLLAWLLAWAVVGPIPLAAQTPAPTSGAPAAQGADSAPPFTSEQLEQVAAPIALYPDALLAQVLMASTYPLEIVQAARFVKANPKLSGDQLNEKLKEQSWDDSVKSLVSFPQALELMNEKLEWTQKLGDAFLADEKGVLAAVQRLRARAQTQGNLKSTSEQTVTVEAAPPAPTQTVVIQEQPVQIIKIEPANPQVIYVPSYNPTVVYGAWPYPAYPPYYPYPAGYAWGAAALSFGVGMAVGAAVWGNANWGRGNVDVDVNRNTNFTKNVNRTDVAANRSARVQQGQSGNRSSWQHNPENRKGVQYRDQGTQQKYNRGSNAQGAQSREAYRGRSDQGGRQGAGGGAQGGGRGSTPGGAEGGGRGQTPGGGQGSQGGGRGSTPGGGEGGGRGQTPGGGQGSQGGGRGSTPGGGEGGGRGQTPGGGQGSQGGGRGSTPGGGEGGGRGQTPGGGQGSPGGRDGGGFDGLGSGGDVRSSSSRGQSSRESAGVSNRGGSGVSSSSGGSRGSGSSSLSGGGGSRGGGSYSGGGGGGRGGGGGGRRRRRRRPRRRSTMRRIATEDSIMRQHARGARARRAERNGDPHGSSQTRGAARRLIAAVVVLASLALAVAPAAVGATAQRRFASLEEATDALIGALRSGEPKALLSILGEQGRQLLSSGDPVSDRRVQERFVASYDEQHRLDAGGGKVVLVVGRDDFPFAIPIVPDGPSWRFDTAAGKDEILNRRIGQNELNTMQVCLAFVDAQREYYARDPDGDGLLHYARTFGSSPGKRDGLYWPTNAGEPPSPLGPLVARARSEGYSRRSESPTPYWGYYYRILTSQGKDAPGGAYDYIAQGRMFGGFALVAFPAKYGVSGVMTFIVNHDGVVYQKNLGPNTAAIAKAMKQFNPDSTWKKP